MEDKIIRTLQDIMDNVKAGTFNEDDFQKEFYGEYMTFATYFAEELTNKKVVVKNWQVSLEPRRSATR